MTTTRLPRYSPFLQGSHCGLPYHGLVRDGILTKINGTTLSYLSVAGHGGEAIPAAGTHAALPTRTPEQVAADEAAGEDWRTYAYLSGWDRNIGGVELGENAWLYNDGNATWKIRAEIVRPVYNDITIKVYLSQLFGRFADDAVDLPAEILLASFAYVPRKITYTTGHGGTGGVSSYSDFYESIDKEMTLLVYPKLDGSQALISVGYGDGAYSGVYPVPLGNKTTWLAFASNDTYDSAWNAIDQAALKEVPFYSSLSGVLMVTVTGIGSLAAGSVGAGITASIEHYKRMDDLMSVVWSHSAFGTDGDHEETSTTTMVQNFLYVFGPDQEIMHATYTLDEAHVPVGTSNEYEVTKDYSASFAGRTVSYSYTATFELNFISYAYTPIVWSGAEGTYCEACSPWIAIDTAFGDRTTLLVETCFPVFHPAATVHAHYVTMDGVEHLYEAAASTISTAVNGVPAPSFAKAHGQVASDPRGGNFATAGLWPKSVVYV